MLGNFRLKKVVVLNLLKSIIVNKSSEPDGIHPRIMREARNRVSGALMEELQMRFGVYLRKEIAIIQEIIGYGASRQWEGTYW